MTQRVSSPPGDLVGDLHRVLVKREAQQASRTFFCVQHFLHENVVQFC